MPCSHRSGANLSGLIDQQPNLINTRGSFNAVYSEFNIRMMISHVGRFKRARNANGDPLGGVWQSFPDIDSSVI